MLWDEALVAGERIEVQIKLEAYELSYHLLQGGPEMVWSHEQDIRRSVSEMREGTEMSADLGRDLFAWVNAAYIARGRRTEDLPSSWRETGFPEE